MGSRIVRWCHTPLRALALTVLVTTHQGVQAQPSEQAGVAPAARPGAPIEQWLSQSGLEPSQLALIARPLGGGPVLARHNADTAMNPASTMKLLTSLAALSVLGPQYRWRTDAHLRGRLADGVLEGDLILRGGGDPKFVIEDLAEFIARMRAAGLREIRGDLVLDDSIYDVGAASVQDFDGDPSQPYNVRPFGMLMNFKAVKFVVSAKNGAASVTLDPPLAGVRLDNRLTAMRGPCRFAMSVASLDGTPGPAVVRVSGAIAPSCGERSVFSSVLDHRAFAEALFRAAWQEAGGRWSGSARIERGAARGDPWLAWNSPRTLADVVNDVNKFSNNLMARHLLLQLAVASGSVPATEEAARGALRDWLAKQGLTFTELVVENGSGLSRTARISAASLARVLEFAAAAPYADLIRGSLPIAGVDGTMKYRLTGRPIAGNAWIKTGSLAEVRTIAGYVDAASGKRYAVVLFANGPRAESAAQLQEQFLRWVHANG